MDPARDIRKHDSERHANGIHLTYNRVYRTEDELSLSDQHIPRNTLFS